MWTNNICDAPGGLDNLNYLQKFQLSLYNN